MGGFRIIRILPLLWFVLLGVHRSDGQIRSDTLDNRTDDIVEAVLENITQDVSDSQLADMILQLSLDPVDLNSASTSELRQIPGIDPILATKIVTRRKSHAFGSVDELILVEGMSPELLSLTRGFFMVANPSDDMSQNNPTTVHIRSRMARDLQDRRGYLDGTYPGSPYKLYNKADLRLGVGPAFYFGVGALTEKDAGERSIGDFATGYLSFGTTSGSLRCVLGDYVLEAGQGLVFWRSSGLSKGSEVMASVTKNPRGLQPYASSDENGFLRGGAIQANVGLFELAAVVSQKAINATLNDEGTITSLDAAGLFRTSTELKKKGSSSEKLVGLNANARFGEDLRVGIRTYKTQFDHSFVLDRSNNIRRQETSLVGIDGSYSTNTVASFAEIAMDRRRSIAGAFGVILEPVPTLDVALVAHSYPRDFVSLHGNGFGGSGGTIRNEQGIYSSVRIGLCDWLLLSAYYDQTSINGSGTVSLLPTHGNEVFVSVRAEPNDRSTLQIQYKRKEQPEAEYLQDEFLRSLSVVGGRIQATYRATLEWRSSSFIRWKTRFEGMQVRYSISGNRGSGMLFFQDIRFTLRRGVSFDARAIVFATDSYDSRIYEYESELRGTFVNPALFGKGIRAYFLARCEILGIEVSAKYSCTIKPGVKTLSSGDSEIKGDTDNQFSIQLDMSL